MINRSLIRKKSFFLLTGRFFAAMVLALFSLLISLAVTLLENGVMKALSIELPTTSDLLTVEALEKYIDVLLADPYTILKLAAVLVGGALLTFLIAAPLHFGTLRWYYSAAQQQPQPLGYALNAYASLKSAVSALWLYIYTGLHYIKWGLLMFAPPAALMCGGVWLRAAGHTGAYSLLMLGGAILLLASLVLFVFVTNRLFLAPYIYAAGDVSVVAATKRSVTLMPAHKSGLLVFQLSLLPLIIIASIACYGFGGLLITPFVSMCLAVYADEIIKRELGQSPSEDEKIEFTVE